MYPALRGRGKGRETPIALIRGTRAGDRPRDSDPAPQCTRSCRGGCWPPSRRPNARKGSCRRGRRLRGWPLRGRGLQGQGVRGHVMQPVPSVQSPPDVDTSSQKGPEGEVAFAQGTDTSNDAISEGSLPCPRREQSPRAPQRQQPPRGRLAGGQEKDPTCREPGEEGGRHGTRAELSGEMHWPRPPWPRDPSPCGTIRFKAHSIR